MSEKYTDSIEIVLGNRRGFISERFADANGIAATGDDARVFASKAHKLIKASITPADKREEGNLRDDIPNIEIGCKKEGVSAGLPDFDPVLRLTWVEARKLCAALWTVTNIAEFS